MTSVKLKFNFRKFTYLFNIENKSSRVKNSIIF